MHVAEWGPPYSEAGTSGMKQGGPHSLPLDQYALIWDFQGQMAVRKQALGRGRKDWVPATGEGRGHAPGSDGAWSRLKGPRQRGASLG